MASAIPRRARALLLVLGTATALLLGGAGTASAHAVLTSSDPAGDSVVQVAPQEVTLAFTETVILADGAVRVLDPEGNRVDKGGSGHADGDSATARVALRPGLPDGTFTVAWKAVSADSHPIAGAFTFSIGEPSETSVRLPQEEPGGGAAGRAFELARYFAYGGFALLTGAAAFVLLCWPAGGTRRPVQRLLLAGWSVLLVATIAMLLLRGPYESGGGLGDAFDLAVVQDTLGTKPGTALAVRLLLLAGAGAFLALLVGQSGRNEPHADVRMGLMAGGSVLAVGLASTWASSEHASVGLQAGIAVPVDVVHMVAMATWLGGLAVLLTALFAPSGPPLPASAVRRFSRLAFISVVVLAVTGTYQSWRQLGSWSAFTSTDYGRLLLWKVVAVAALVGVAWYSRRWTNRLRGVPQGRADRGTGTDGVPARKNTGTGSDPAGPDGARNGGAQGNTAKGGGAGDGGAGSEGAGRAAARPLKGRSGDPARAAELARQRAAVAAARVKRERDADPLRANLRKSVFAEVAIGVVVLSVTTVLTTTEPGRTVEQTAATAPAASTASGPAVVNVLYDTGGTNGRGKAEITLDPGRKGENTVHVYVTDGAGRPSDVEELKVSFTLPEKELGPLDVKLKHLDIGHWTSGSVQLPMAGGWKVAVLVRTSDIDQVTETAKVKIG